MKTKMSEKLKKISNLTPSRKQMLKDCPYSKENKKWTIQEALIKNFSIFNKQK